MPQDGDVMLAVIAAWSAWAGEPSLLNDNRINLAWLKTARREWDALLTAAQDERATPQGDRPETPPLQIVLQLTAVGGTPLQPVDSSPVSQEAWLEEEQRQCEATLQPTSAPTSSSEAGMKLQPSDVAHLPAPRLTIGELTALIQRHVEETDPRSEQDYRAQVQQYIAQCSEQLATAVRRAAQARLTPVRVRLTNRTNLNLRDVELRLYIPGEVDAYRTVSYASNESVTGLPTRPTPFGSARRKSIFQQAVTASIGMTTTPGLSNFPGARSLYVPDPSLPDIVNGGSATITYQLGDIRPQGHADARGVIILASAPAAPLITAT
ncbi:hypothetical protein ACFYYB_40970 [Streptomyces sp. NPDC002886]|uniref:hypothetical protein n=1 Tax=Streptomyces sp. NPDC002886 TaxID=3364667 RepID=UPI0036BEA77D